MKDENVLPEESEGVEACDCGFAEHPGLSISIQRPIHEMHHKRHTDPTPIWTIRMVDDFEGNFEAKCGYADCPV